MTVRPIRQYGDPVLRQPCRLVTKFDHRLAGLVEDLIETCRLPGRAGLAAPQIGVLLRAFSYNIDGFEGYVVNPTLAETGGTQGGTEGCLSIPGLRYETPRADWAVVTGVDLEGKPITVEGDGELGRCLQHETDHLDGRLYIDRLEPATKRQAMRAIRNMSFGDGLRPDGLPELRPRN